MSLVKGFFCGVVLSHVPTTGGDKRLTRGCLLSWVRPADSFMGNLSVNKDQPGFAPKSISHFFYTVVKKDAIKDCPFLMGTPFQGNTHQCLKDAMTLDGRSQYAIVAVPVAFPVCFGVPGIAVGPPSDEVDAFFASAHSSGALWYHLVCAHETKVGQTILDNATTLAAILPKTPGSTMEPDPFCKFHALDPAEQETIYLSQCAAHTANLSTLLHPPTPTVINLTAGGSSAISGTPGGGGGLDEVSVLTPTPAKETKFKLGENRVASHSLLHGRFITQGDGTFMFQPSSLRDVMESCLLGSKPNHEARAVGDLMQQCLLHNSGKRNCLLDICIGNLWFMCVSRICI